MAIVLFDGNIAEACKDAFCVNGPLTVVPVTAFWAARSKFPCVIIELVLLRSLRPIVTSSNSGISYSLVITDICLFDGN